MKLNQPKTVDFLYLNNYNFYCKGVLYEKEIIIINN